MAGDLWADVEVGKRDFTEIAVREVVDHKVNSPGGVAIDRAAGKAYVWDSGNSRILGFDLATCNTSHPCHASLVIGQPALVDYGACNGDSSYQTYPERPPSSSTTLCGVREDTHTTLEDKSFVGLFVDSAGTLWAPDYHNHRVLKYRSPFTTDTVADDVWGQSDFAGNQCNRGAEAPSAQTLCFHEWGPPYHRDSFGAAVTLDAALNLWVADGGNNRVLRFPRNPSSKVISKSADLVLGQSSFTTNGSGGGLNQFHSPTEVRFGPDGRLYVADEMNRRVLVFTPPFTTGMQGRLFVQLPAGEGGHLNLEVDTAAGGVWTSDYTEAASWSTRLKLWNFDGTPSGIAVDNAGAGRGGGSIGIDGAGNLYTASYSGADIFRWASANGYRSNGLFAEPPWGANLRSPTARRFEHPAWVGVAATSTQLVASDGRLLFWDNPKALANGQAPSGCVGGCSEVPHWETAFQQLKAARDGSGEWIWADRVTEVHKYRAPVASDSQPVLRLLGAEVLGGGTVSFAGNGANGRPNSVWGLAWAPGLNGGYLFVAQPHQHRVLRIRDLATTPLVDMVLGQIDVRAANQCNRGAARSLETLCWPGALSVDRRGNLYVSDHFLEAQGNFRLLMFRKEIFPPAPSHIVYAPAASKEFANKWTFEPAFNSSNQMVVGYNPYSGRRFVDYYGDPAGPATEPDGRLGDFYGWPVAATFDSSDNLYVFDANRGKVNKYLAPLSSPF